MLVVAPEEEDAALKVVAAIADAEPASERLKVVADPRLSGKRYYVMADPARSSPFVWARVRGNGLASVPNRQGFEIDGVQIKARTTFAAAAIDFRGAVTGSGE